LPFKLRGTADKPKVKIDAKRLTKESSTKLINEVLNFGFLELQKRMETVEIKQVPSSDKEAAPKTKGNKSGAKKMDVQEESPENTIKIKQ